jgi:hypothetical protein
MQSPLLISVVFTQQFKFARKAVDKLCKFLQHKTCQFRTHGASTSTEESKEREEDASCYCAGGVHGAFIWGHVQFRERQLVDQKQQNWTVQARVFWQAQAVSSCAMLCAASGRVLWA